MNYVHLATMGLLNNEVLREMEKKEKETKEMIERLKNVDPTLDELLNVIEIIETE